MPSKNYTQQQHWRHQIEEIHTGLALSSTSTRTFIILITEQMRTRKINDLNSEPNNDVLQGVLRYTVFGEEYFYGPWAILFLLKYAKNCPFLLCLNHILVYSNNSYKNFSKYPVNQFRDNSKNGFTQFDLDAICQNMIYEISYKIFFNHVKLLFEKLLATLLISIYIYFMI